MFPPKKSSQTKSLIVFFVMLVACVPASLLEGESASGARDEAQLSAVYATVGDTGLATPQSGSKEAAVQAAEANAIVVAYQNLEISGFKSAEDWEAGAQTISKTLSFVPMTHSELVDKANAEINGEVYTEPASLELAEALEQQKIASREYSEQLLKDLTGLSSEQLINLRIKLTVALAILKTQSSHNTGPERIDDDFLELVESTNQSLRDSAIEEMRRRGIVE